MSRFEPEWTGEPIPINDWPNKNFLGYVRPYKGHGKHARDRWAWAGAMDVQLSQSASSRWPLRWQTNFFSLHARSKEEAMAYLCFNKDWIQQAR